MSKSKLRPGDAAIEASGLRPGPEHLARDLPAYFARFQQGATHFALEALIALILAEHHVSGLSDEEFQQLDQQRSVSVPWWIVQHIGVAYMLADGDGKQFAVKLGIARPRRGHASPQEAAEQMDEEMRRAVEVAGALRRLGKLDAAIRYVSERFDVSETQIKASWRKFGKIAMVVEERGHRSA